MNTVNTTTTTKTKKVTKQAPLWATVKVRYPSRPRRSLRRYA